MATLNERERAELDYHWPFWARPKQLPPPGDWRVWLLLAGRGFGKTRTATEWARMMATEYPGSRGALVGATAADSRDVLVEGESGLLAVCPPWNTPTYEPSKRRVTWPNGTMATLYSADEPNRLRGPQHHWAIADELAHWRYPETWDMLMFGLRLGDDPRVVAPTTPKPIPLIKELLQRPDVEVTRGSTYENRPNLAEAFFRQIITKYEGTRLGQQELHAEILDDDPNALWNRALLEETRVTEYPAPHRVIVAIDPAASTGTTGIVVAGAARVGQELHGYTLDDASLQAGASPAEWGGAAVAAYNRHRADLIVAEVNNGGDMVENVIRNVAGGERVPYRTIRASRGKHTRAEPIAAIFEQGRGHMVGYFGELEDQLCSWVPGDDSPDRLDAMVWAFTELMGDESPDFNDISDLGRVEEYANPWA